MGAYLRLPLMDQSLVDLFSLDGRVAIVTGSTKGLGRAMVEGYAQAGASVVVSSRKQALCEPIAAEIEDATGQAALGAACHMGDWDAVARSSTAVMERFGRIDVLVNNAGHPSRADVGDRHDPASTSTSSSR